MLKILLIISFLLFSSEAFSYIGPGAGISVLGSLLGILATIVVAIGAIVFWPLRKFLKRRKQRQALNAEKTESEEPNPEKIDMQKPDIHKSDPHK